MNGIEIEDMIKEIEDKFAVLEAQLDGLIKETSSLTPEQFQFKPSADSWSISQVFQHLIKAEGASNAYMKKKIQAGKGLKKSGIKASLSVGMLRMLMRSPFKFKAPSLVKVDPEQNHPFEDQVAAWKAERREMKEFLDGLDAETSGKLIFKHGSGIRMNAGQMVDWTGSHAGRHIKQIERLRSSTDFPQNHHSD